MDLRKMISLFLIALSMGLVSCSPNQWAPNHFALNPSYEVEMQQGQEMKHKPRIGATLDWNM